MNLYVVYLRFGENKAKARDLMPGHNEWISKNVGAGTFLVFGSLTSNEGGCIVALSESKEAIDLIIGEDPFVKEEVVVPEVVEVSINGTNPKIADLI